MILKQDNLKTGILLGLVAPMIGVLFFYFLKFFPTFSFGEYIHAVFANKPLLTAVSSISLLINVVIFTIYINRHFDQTAKGIFLLTVLYIVFVLIYKIL